MNTEAPPGLTIPAEETPQVSPRDLIGFVFRSARRNWLLCVSVFIVVGSLGTIVASAIPAIFESTTKLYSSQNAMITAALASGRSSGMDPSASTRGLTETVLSHDNLLAISREGKILQGWPRTRTWPLRIKDQVFAWMFGPPAVKDQEEVLVEMLERAVIVGPEDVGSIRFRVWWRDPAQAFTLVNLAARNFIAHRRTEELSAISRATGLLEDELRRADQSIPPAIKEVQDKLAKARAAARNVDKDKDPAPPSGARAPAAAPKPAAPAVVATSPAVAKRAAEIPAKLDEIRRSVRDAIEPWQRRNAELKFQLAELRATYGPEHPLVRQQEVKVDANSIEPAELARLKEREAQLMAELTNIGLDEEVAASTAPARSAGGGGRSILGGGARDFAPLRSLIERDPEDPEVSAARQRLDAVLFKSREVQSRLDSARIELATAEASFKYRYTVVEPAAVARSPMKPKRALLYAGAFAAALILGLLAGAARELLSGRLLESWQVRNLGLPVLAEVDYEKLVSSKH